MAVQFDRRYELQVADLVIRDLDLVFKVTKTLKTAPNTLEATIYNLNGDHRGQLQEAEDPIVQLSAGYKDRIGVIFLGGVRDVVSDYDPPDWSTVLGSGDGEKEIQTSRINKSFASGTSLATVIKQVGGSMNLGLGNLDAAAGAGQLVEAGGEFLNGVTVSGQSSREMDRLAKSAGLEWSIQDRTLQILKAGQTLNDTAVVLTPATGLIGSPTIGNDGVIKLRALLNSDVIPGRQIILKSRILSARLRAEVCTYTGNSAGGDWFVDVEAKELKT